MKKQTMIMAAALFAMATAKAELVLFSSAFGGLDPWAFVFHGSPYSHRNLLAGPIVPGQPSGTSVTGAFELGGSYAIDFGDTLNGPVADVTFDLLGTSQTLAGFIVRAPLGRANFYAVTLDEALQGMFTINAPLPPKYQPQTGFRPIDKIAIITCEGVCRPAGELLPDGGATVMLLAMALAALGISNTFSRRRISTREP
jgi:hypothetical protein